MWCMYACNSWAFSPPLATPSYLLNLSQQKHVFPHQFPINILCCRIVKTLVILCLFCSGRYGAEGTAPSKLRSPRWRVRVNSEPYSASSLACTLTGICSIMNPNITARIREKTSLVGPCGIRPAMTGVHRLHGTVQLSFIWKINVYFMAKINQMNIFSGRRGCSFSCAFSAWREETK